MYPGCTGGWLTGVGADVGSIDWCALRAHSYRMPTQLN